MKKMGGLALAGALVVVVILVLNSGDGPGRPESATPSSEFDDFPLWREVPGHSFATLGEGKLPSGTRWAAYASRASASRNGRENPCLTVARITATPGFGQNNQDIECGPLTPVREGWSPVTAILAILDTAQEQGQTIMAMSFKPSIASILITPADGEPIRKRTHLLNRYQRRKAHLPALRYVALGVEEEICIEKVVGYGAYSEVAFEGQYKDCRPSPFGYSSRARLLRNSRGSEQP